LVTGAWPIANRPQLDKLFAMIVPLIDMDENGLPVGQAGSLRRVANPPHRQFSRVPHKCLKQELLAQAAPR
jgi:hypothetical protein